MQEQMGIFPRRHLSFHKGVCFEFVYFAKLPMEAVYERMKPHQKLDHFHECIIQAVPATYVIPLMQEDGPQMVLLQIPPQKNQLEE